MYNSFLRTMNMSVEVEHLALHIVDVLNSSLPSETEKNVYIKVTFHVILMSAHEYSENVMVKPQPAIASLSPHRLLLTHPW